MGSEVFSLLIRCNDDTQTDALQLRIVDVSTVKDLHFKDGAFLVRVTLDTDTAVIRCMIRHVASGDEVHMQGGPHLRTFICAHLQKG